MGCGDQLHEVVPRFWMDRWPRAWLGVLELCLKIRWSPAHTPKTFLSTAQSCRDLGYYYLAHAHSASRNAYPDPGSSNLSAGQDCSRHATLLSDSARRSSVSRWQQRSSLCFYFLGAALRLRDASRRLLGGYCKLLPNPCCHDLSDCHHQMLLELTHHTCSPSIDRARCL